MPLQSRTKIVFIDDDTFFLKPYMSEVEAEFDVKHYRSAAEAVEELSGLSERIILILDVMMPCPSEYAHETEHGHTTGIWVLKHLANIIYRTDSCVIFFTNVDLLKMHKYKDAPEFRLLEIEILPKKSVAPGALLNKISKLI